MPIYNEDPARTTAALYAMAEALAQIDAARHFEIAIISDSTNADAWISESLAVDQLRRDLRETMPVWYRRRWHNTGRKAGNVEDFVKRWGARYDYMIVLDADSIMAPQTLVALVSRMQADPQLGILQTVPMLIGHWSLFSRIQQFAGRVYGSLIGRGVAAWSGNEGNFWGHNAIIRVAAFAQACGLPQLPGRRPFGGHVLSHDFVEAALMRRAGWKVRMAPDLGGSWEESPPSLVDIAIRDRRWAQGNLQHSKIVGAKGLATDEPRALRHRHHGLPVLAAVDDAAARRLRADSAGDADPPRVFQPQLPAVPGLAAVRRAAHDGAVHLHDDRAVHAEDARPAAHDIFVARAPRLRRRHRSRRSAPSSRRSCPRCMRRS